ncbi:phosphate ABC transporter substrate-binding protein [Pseudenhygromyxa sp. WMMC2535]|uniref:phosphate ABC transporter substrate-binding protein n=1 Tax=Pseudenhygromyxa sp. WMMC2535 TaxID=2712867 RepID=UPI0031F9ABDB
MSCWVSPRAPRLLTCTALLFAALACSDAAEQAAEHTLTIRGSDTMVILAQRWAEAYMDEHPEIAVQVSGGGSGTGITALIAGTTDLANASREIADSEAELLARERGVPVFETTAAIDAVAIYVHRDNPIASVSLAELEDVFRGRVEDWSALGVEDLGAITLYSRENNSGTYAYFKDRVLAGYDFASEAQTLPGTAAVINAVSKDPRAIGYGGIGYAAGVRVVPLRLDSGEIAAASGAQLRAYPLARPLLIYTAGEPEGEAARFIEFVRGPPGQALVRELGFFPLPEPMG